jgi:4a-hydroxytetrahydrobiopterin dehydratase
MSEQGWRAFVGAEGITDWVVLHGGPTAVFRVGSLADGARLAVAFAGVAGLDPRTTLTLTHTKLTVRLTREMWGVEPEHVNVARALSAVAHEQGAVADRSAAQEVQVAIAAKPDAIDVGFWRAVLGYDGVSPDNGIDPLGVGSTVWMQDIDASKPLRHAMHIDVSLAHEEGQRRVDAAVAAGGTVVKNSNAPGGWTLADRSGNKVCIAAWPDGAETPEWADAGTETTA